jgi:hypothetical protein
MSVRDELYDLVMLADITPQEMYDLGYTRSQVQSHMASLIDDGLVFKHARGKATYYSRNSTPAGVKDPSRSRRAEIVLPDLPKFVLWWMGYTDKVPDPHAGEVHQPLK